tara:strand:- start:359 stop:946 length:588 start_codon:yes stop_codon:yes gene_type:complete
MANIDQAFGLRPIAKIGSAPGGTTGTTKYSIADNQSTAIFTGDPVKYKNDGTVEVATASDAILGVFMGCFYTDPTTSKPTFRNYFPASLSPGDAIAFVADDPDQMYIAQQDSVGSNLVAADLNLNANLIFGAGSTTSGISGVEIDSSSGAVTATHQVRLIAFYDTPSNDATANNSDLVVKINNHSLNGGTGTVGL